jgi:hypothetical protein
MTVALVLSTLAALGMAASARAASLRTAELPQTPLEPASTAQQMVRTRHGANGPEGRPVLLQAGSKGFPGMGGSSAMKPPEEEPLKVPTHTIRSFVESNQADKADPAASMCSMCLRIANQQLLEDSQNNGLFCKGLDGPGQQESVSCAPLRPVSCGKRSCLGTCAANPEKPPCVEFFL